MREATVLGLFLAGLAGLLSITQIDSLATNIQVVTSGPISTFVGTWPFIMVGVVFIVVAGLAIAAVSRH